MKSSNEGFMSFVTNFLFLHFQNNAIMSNKVLKMLTSLSICFLTGCGRDFTADADRFLSSMSRDLQQRQERAIRRAIDGDITSLQQVRAGRNTDAAKHPAVEVEEISPVLRLYVPRQRSEEPLPLLVYLHGGGWTIGSIRSCARFCTELAATGQVIVLAVEYRLAPEHPFPAGLDDCVEAVRTARLRASEWGSSTGMVSVGGDSSGGNLALATALRLVALGEEVPRSLVLFYPVVSAWNDGSYSWQKYERGAALDGSLMEAFNEAYCRGSGEQINIDPHRNMFVSPSVAPDSLLSRFPPTMLIAAERDILCSQGKKFADRLRMLGVDIYYKLFVGSVHLFITVPGQEKAFHQAVEKTASFLTSLNSQQGKR